LLDRFSELQFFDLQDKYRIAATDLPTDTVTLRIGERRKSIENYSTGARADPWGREYEGWQTQQALKALAEAIDSVLGLENWIERDTPNPLQVSPPTTAPLGIREQDLPAVRITLDSIGDENQSSEYRIVMAGDGGVEWEGRKYVREVGPRTAAIPVDDVRRVLLKLERSGFLDMGPVEFSGVDVCCGVSLGLSLPGRTQRIDGARLLRRRNESPAPAMVERSIELRALARAIRVAARADRWIGGWDEGHPPEVEEDR
jgi:hypothetical protein